MSSKKTRTTLTVVEKLIEQRRLFQDWMDKLTAGVDGMPPHVVERVRNDYRDRLTAVMTELGEHRDALREALDESQQRHDELDDQHQAKKDELAELRLRRHVGEMDEGRFKEQSNAMQVGIDQVKKDLASALRDIERYEEILDVIAEGDKPVEEEEEEEKAPVAAKVEPKVEKPAVRPEPEAEPPRTERKSSPDVKKPGVDELAFLRSVTTTVGAVKAPPAPPPAPAPPPKAKEPAPAPVNFEAAPGLINLPPAPVEAPAPVTTQAPPAAKKEDGLTCGECGAKNRPTEWYCEKCGAELAAF